MKNEHIDDNFIQLRGGVITTDPRLGRIASFDPRSKNYPIRELFGVEHTVPRSYSWRCLQWLDQGDTPACTGFSMSHELIARPKEVQGITNDTAYALYKLAQQNDEWPGDAYEGSSVLGAVKAAKIQGYITEYRWAFDTNDFAIAVSWFGTGVVGINWYDSMFNVDVNGFVTITKKSRIAGGHAICVRGFSVKKNAFLLRNSWGLSWGVSGDAWISFDDMDRLLHEQGEALIPVVRLKIPEPEKLAA